MKFNTLIETVFMLIGCAVVCLFILGTFGVGHFRVIYTFTDPLVCTSDFKQNPLNPKE